MNGIETNQTNPHSKEVEETLEELNAEEAFRNDFYNEHNKNHGGITHLMSSTNGFISTELNSGELSIRKSLQF